MIWAVFFAWMLSSCQSVPHPVPQTDWADVTLVVVGTGATADWSPEGRIRAVQQAKQDALYKLTEQVLALPTDASEPLSKQAKKGDLMEKIKAYVRGAQVVLMENTTEGARVQARLFLGDHFKATLGLLPRKEIAPTHPTEGRGEF
jgi:hypothetical protein